MKSSTFLGSAFSVLLTFSAISYSRTLVQDPKTVPPAQPPTQPLPGPLGQSAGESAKQQSKASDALGSETVKAPTSLTEIATEKTASPADASAKPVKAIETAVTTTQTYTATAYSLRGRTASGRPPSRGVIAADPSLLPLGTRVRVEAGSLSGEYIVADTGGAVRGRHIDIWTPTTREARQFGRRAVKLTVLTLGIKRESRPRARRKH